jgi:hypothetical protein
MPGALQEARGCYADHPGADDANGFLVLAHAGRPSYSGCGEIAVYTPACPR